MDRIADLVRQLEPDSAPPKAGARARQRAALARSMAAADGIRPLPRPRRWRFRQSVWLAAIACAAALAVVAAVVLPGPSSPSQRSARPPAAGRATSAVLTAITGALADTSGDVEEVRSTVANVSATSWVNLATAACRTDTSASGRLVLTVFDEHGSVVIIDYGHRRWWTRGSAGVTCHPLTPRVIEADLVAGRFTLAGHATVDGQQSLKLVSATTSQGPVAKLTTLWVNATTYLPIQSTSAGHLIERTLFTWLPATAASTAPLKIAVPTGFQQVAAPPAGSSSGG